jgi:hypothetical protein
MHPAENRVNLLSPRDSRYVFQGVHNARVATSQQHDNALGALNVKCLVVSEWVRLRAGSVQWRVDEFVVVKALSIITVQQGATRDFRPFNFNHLRPPQIHSF